jgi:hypothetical protein
MERETMRFMMLMIPKGYEKAEPGAMPDAKAVAAMMKYNESLQGLKKCRRMPSGLGSRDAVGTVVRVGPTADLILADCDGDS